jgi:AsmA protein
VNDLQVHGTLAASTLQAQEFTLTNVHTNCSMRNGVVELSPLSADLFGGKGEGSVTVDTKPAHPVSSVKAKLTGVDTNSLLSAVSSVKNTLYGSLAGDANVGLTLDSSSNLARTLNGTVDFNVTNGQLKNINMLNELSRIGKFVGRAPSQSASGTALKRFSGTFHISNGVATTNNLIAALDEGSLSATGSLNLSDQAINMHVTAVLAAGPSQQVGGSGVGGFLNTALANKNGELVLPVVVTGTAAKPIVTPDVQALAQMRLKNLLPTSTDPGKLTTGLINSIGGKQGAGGVLGGILGGASGQQKTNQQDTNQQNPVDSILKQFGKKKKQQ